MTCDYCGRTEDFYNKNLAKARFLIKEKIATLGESLKETQEKLRRKEAILTCLRFQKPLTENFLQLDLTTLEKDRKTLLQVEPSLQNIFNLLDMYQDIPAVTISEALEFARKDSLLQQRLDVDYKKIQSEMKSVEIGLENLREEVRFFQWRPYGSIFGKDSKWKTIEPRPTGDIDNHTPHIKIPVFPLNSVDLPAEILNELSLTLCPVCYQLHYAEAYASKYSSFFGQDVMQNIESLQSWYKLE